MLSKQSVKAGAQRASRCGAGAQVTCIAGLLNEHSPGVRRPAPVGWVPPQNFSRWSEDTCLCQFGNVRVFLEGRRGGPGPEAPLVTSPWTAVLKLPSITEPFVRMNHAQGKASTWTGKMGLVW